MFSICYYNTDLNGELYRDMYGTPETSFPSGGFAYYKQKPLDDVETPRTITFNQDFVTGVDSAYVFLWVSLTGHSAYFTKSTNGDGEIELTMDLSSWSGVQSYFEETITYQVLLNGGAPLADLT